MQIPEKPWTGTNKSVLKDLESQVNGLSSSEVDKRLFKFGTNVINHHNPIPYFGMIISQFTDVLVLMLVFASALSFLLGEFRNGVIIGAIVLLNALIGFTQEFKVQRILKALNKLLPNFAKVKRDGVEKQIHANYLVPGDIVILGSGDKIPADMRILECYDLRVDEKTLTGESRAQAKEVAESINSDIHLTEAKNCLFMGTTITDGEALAVVTMTGLKTQFGRIAQQTTQIEKTYSPLQEKTQKMSKKIAIIAIILMLALIVYKYFQDYQILSALVFAVAIAASLVPEGLPATISVALSIGARNLAKQKALARNLVSVETLGSVTVICTDKTGTLTTGQMAVKDLWQDIADEINDNEKKKLANEVMILCSDAQIHPKPLGDSMEIALLEYAESCGSDIEDIRNKYQKIGEVPFNAKLKMMSVTYQEGGRKFSYSKGAPEVLIEKCHLDSKEKKIILAKVDNYAKEGHRVLGLSYNNIFLGLVSIYDPPRDEVKDSIKKCKESHIRVVMITGDNPVTAASIAKATGITHEEDPQVILGDHIDKISDTELRNILLGEPIFARVLPEHKYRIVDNLMKMGEIVAVTGDGVNDAPALKRADIGVAMGKTGTDVSREAAGLILLDDNFATIVSTISIGRVIFDNIKKFLFFIFSHNFGELGIVLLGFFSGMPLALTAVQILAIDLGTDVLPSIAMTFEKPEKDVMKTKPRAKEVQLLTGESFIHLTLIGLIIGIGAIVNFAVIYKTTGNYREATTMSFATLAVAQFFNAFLSRTGKTSIFRYPFWQNGYMFLAVFGSIIVTLIMIYYSPMSNFLMNHPLPLSAWPRIMMIGVVLIVFEEIYKLVLNRKKLPN